MNVHITKAHNRAQIISDNLLSYP